MKAKIPKSVVFILVLVGGGVFCFGLFYLFDHFLNGVIIGWFSENFTTTESHYMADTGRETYTQTVQWWKLKDFIFWVVMITILLVITIVFLVSHFYAKRKVRKTLTSTSELIKTYMGQTVDATDIFPRAYSEISAQMVQVKSIMQRQEQALKEEAVRKNDLITYLAHDLKTPLTSVIGYLSLLEEAPDMPAEQKAKYVHITLDKANRLEKLINEFFDITRYNLQQIVLEKESIDLHYMLLQMTDEFYPILSAHGNTAVLHAQENLTINGDSIKLARVFNNILKNAIFYSFPNTEIEVSVQSTDTDVQIRFVNHGKTIPQQRLTTIFEKFFRLDDARATNTGGAGLGLAIAQEIVTLHGGSITAQSENEVTTFCVTLPLF